MSNIIVVVGPQYFYFSFIESMKLFIFIFLSRMKQSRFTIANGAYLLVMCIYVIHQCHECMNSKSFNSMDFNFNR